MSQTASSKINTRYLRALILAHNGLPLSDQEMTAAISYVLLSLSISHTLHYGWVFLRTNSLLDRDTPFHWWIELDTRDGRLTIDLCAGLWLGVRAGVPYGLFSQPDYPDVVYTSHEIHQSPPYRVAKSAWRKLTQ